jgi:hypothetical protein
MNGLANLWIHLGQALSGQAGQPAALSSADIARARRASEPLLSGNRPPSLNQSCISRRLREVRGSLGEALILL